MTETISKAERIRTLYATGKYTTRQIADVVGCDTPYVRVVARQRSASGGLSRFDSAYMIKRCGSVKAYWRAMNTRPERKAYLRKRRAEARAS